MSIAESGNVAAGALGLIVAVAAIVVRVMGKRRLTVYLVVTAYILFVPIHIWFWQFALTERAPAPAWYIWNGVVIQLALGGVLPLIVLCFHRFRPVVTALLLVYTFSLLLQLFSYAYWANGTTRNFSMRLSHLDSFYFALGTLTTAGTGNISAISETARGLQALQMGIDLVFVGFVVALVVARYTNLFAHSQAELPRDGTTAKPTSAVVSSDQSQHASQPNRPCSDHPADEDEAGRQRMRETPGAPGEPPRT